MRMTPKRYEAARFILNFALADLQAIGPDEKYDGKTSKEELEEGLAWLQHVLNKHKPKKVG